MNIPTGGPKEPSADIRTLASVLRQTYLALIAEGFSEAEAMAIIGQTLAAGASAYMQHGGDK
jgi:hypothetical protein